MSYQTVIPNNNTLHTKKIDIAQWLYWDARYKAAMAAAGKAN